MSLLLHFTTLCKLELILKSESLKFGNFNTYK
jgi:hypothetical protein